MSPVITPLAQPPVTAIRRVTVEEFYQIDAQREPEDTRRLELIDGKVITIMPPGPRHSSYNSKVHHAVIRRAGEEVLVRCQEPVSINRFNHPQPDIAVVKRRDDFYLHSHPSPEDILLIIEVSDSSLEFDLNDKRRTYARAEIEEYWVLDVNLRELHVFSGPWNGDYTRHATYASKDEVASTTVSGIRLQVSEMLPPP